MPFQSNRTKRSKNHGLLALLCLFAGVSAGCLDTHENEVVVYTALDREFSEPILDQFEQTSGVRVLAKYDVESTKTVGLANEIINQANRQRADVFWNNEILHTLRLKKRGLLSVVEIPGSDPFPPSFVSRDRDWFGFAARARVFLVNTEILKDRATWPDSIADLADSQWQGKCAMARPLFGTTATHAAVLFTSWGEDRATEFFGQVARNASIESGNKQVAQKVAKGQFAFGMTDTDDAIIEIERGAPVAIVFPDQKADQSGTLLIPNTLCVIQNGPNTENAQRLLEFLLRAKIEEQLAAGPSAQIPLSSQATARSRIQPECELKMMQVDFQAAADAWDGTSQILNRLFPIGR